MNNLDKDYQDLLRDIISSGVVKQDRTGTGTLSVFGRQIRHKMSDGFPLLTTKKMYWKGIVTELLWFLRGDTNIKFLVDNDCHIWNGDAYKRFTYYTDEETSMERFIELIKTDDEFAKKWGDLGPVYGKQWRDWGGKEIKVIDGKVMTVINDQIQNLINDLKTNPDSRRLMVSAWNVGELDQMVLPPCHYGFQVYTRDLTLEERRKLVSPDMFNQIYNGGGPESLSNSEINQWNVPTKAISLMWNQRSVDVFLGLPFNIASYGLLLEIIAKEVNMIPDELIGNLGDTHLYFNHIDQAKEQIGKKYTPQERESMLKDAMSWRKYNKALNELAPFGGGMSEYYETHKIPKTTRDPYPLPKLNFNMEWWDEPFMQAVMSEAFCKCLIEEDIQLAGYQSHPTIKAPLNN
jgi:thymidylate synthase